MKNIVNELPSKEYLEQCFEFEESSGSLIWKKRPPEHFAKKSSANVFNARMAGQIAGCVLKTRTGKKYMVVKINYCLYYAHRVIFKLLNGVDPEIVDHLDGDGTNNLPQNLRSCQTKDNAKNTRLRITNSSGCMGVSWSEKKGKWRSYITLDGKQKYLGNHLNYSDAVEARKRAEIEYKFHPNHGLPREL